MTRRLAVRGDGGLRRWWQLARPFSLTAAVVPVLAGTAFAALDDGFRALPFLAMLLASVLIQAGTNMFNEYYDYVRGVDTPQSVGIAGALVSGDMPPWQVLAGALGCFAGALALGTYLIAAAGPMMLVGGALSAFAGFVYSGGPRPVSSTPFGEAEVFVFMGPMIVALAYYAQAEDLAWTPLYGSLPVACLVAAILLANNIRDVVGDGERGRRTLAVALGRDAAIIVFRGLLYAAYGFVALGAATLVLPWTALAVVVTLPQARAQVTRFRRSHRPAELNAAVRGTAQLHLRFGLLYTAALLAYLPFD